MSNPNTPFGFKPVGHLLGLNWSDQVRKCYMTGANGATYIGDAVDLEGSADVTGAYPTVVAATAGATHPIAGVVVGFEPDPTDLTILYRKTSTNRYPLVIFDPFVIYEIQGNAGAVITKDMVGANAVFTNGGGSTATGLSGMVIAAATTPTAAATYQLLILGAATDPLNDISSVYARWLVLISLHRFGSVFSGAQAGWLGV